MNTLVQAIKTETNRTVTENNAIALRTSKSNVLDFFALGGALRQRPTGEVENIFSLAFAEDKLLALKTLSYLRDIRGGQGERKTFRTILNFLGRNYPELVIKNLEAFVEYGRWDDLLSLFGTKAEGAVLTLIERQIVKDLKDAKKEKSISLLAKWLPSINTSSQETVSQAYKICTYFEWDAKKYRQTLSLLRKYLDVVERKMCANLWKKIDYSHVPSKAGITYRKSFAKHDTKRYAKWQADVAKGKSKINASVLFPYEIVEKAVGDNDKTLDLAWKALPDFCQDNPNSNGIVVADVSGSMSGRPMMVSVSLAMYFAERNKGPFKNSFITFSGNPQLQQVQGDNICEKVRNLMRAEWEMNTNLQAVFDLILNTGLKYKIKQTDMPDAIYIVSDMQFDQATTENKEDNFNVIKQKYQDSGYKMPKLVFWNVRATNDNMPVAMDDKNTVLVSGCSPVIFKTALSGGTPYRVMMETLSQERYNLLRI